MRAWYGGVPDHSQERASQGDEGVGAGAHLVQAVVVALEAVAA